MLATPSANRAYSMPCTAGARSRKVSTNPRRAFIPKVGSKVAASPPSAATVTRRILSGGDPHQLDSAFDFLGAEDNTATSDFFASFLPGATMPELPKKDRRPTDAGAQWTQPPESS